MDKKIGLSFFITVLVQAFIYEQMGDAGKVWTGTLSIIGMFALIYFLLVYSAIRKEIKRAPDKHKESKIVDLDQFRKRKKELSTPEEQSDSFSNQWAPLFISNDPSKMELVYSLLQSYNIECHISNRHVASLYPSIEGLDMILQVNPKDQQRCVEILKKHDLQHEDG